TWGHTYHLLFDERYRIAELAKEWYDKHKKANP
ncbi:unnamed protein product, partial [marine sediment metagenome]